MMCVVAGAIVRVDGTLLGACANPGADMRVLFGLRSALAPGIGPGRAGRRMLPRTSNLALSDWVLAWGRASRSPSAFAVEKPTVGILFVVRQSVEQSILRPKVNGRCVFFALLEVRVLAQEARRCSVMIAYIPSPCA